MNKFTRLRTTSWPPYPKIKIFWGSLVYNLSELFVNVLQLVCEPLFFHACYVPYVGFYIEPVPHSCHILIMCSSLCFSLSFFSFLPAPLYTFVLVKIGIGNIKEQRAQKRAWRLKIEDWRVKSEDLRSIFTSSLYPTSYCDYLQWSLVTKKFTNK